MRLEHGPSLPVELLYEIFEEVRSNDTSDLLSIRLANHNFCAIVTPVVFRNVHIHNASTARNLRSILTSPHLAKEIKDISVMVDPNFSESQLSVVKFADKLISLPFRRRLWRARRTDRHAHVPSQSLVSDRC
jgi:hypothetical protein